MDQFQKLLTCARNQTPKKLAEDLVQDPSNYIRTCQPNPSNNSIPFSEFHCDPNPKAACSVNEIDNSVLLKALSSYTRLGLGFQTQSQCFRASEQFKNSCETRGGLNMLGYDWSIPERPTVVCYTLP